MFRNLIKKIIQNINKIVEIFVMGILIKNAIQYSVQYFLYTLIEAINYFRKYVISLCVIYNPLMANSMGDASSFIREESDNNIFNCSDNAAVANSDVETNDINKLKTEVMT